MADDLIRALRRRIDLPPSAISFRSPTRPIFQGPSVPAADISVSPAFDLRAALTPPMAPKKEESGLRSALRGALSGFAEGFSSTPEGAAYEPTLGGIGGGLTGLAKVMERRRIEKMALKRAEEEPYRKLAQNIAEARGGATCAIEQNVAVAPARRHVQRAPAGQVLAVEDADAGQDGRAPLGLDIGESGVAVEPELERLRGGLGTSSPSSWVRAIGAERVAPHGGAVDAHHA